jgi:hypothetical protein
VKRKHTTAPTLALSYEEAAEALGYSLPHFKRHCLPELPRVYSGARVTIRVASLEAWAAQNECLPGAAGPSTMKGGQEPDE